MDAKLLNSLVLTAALLAPSMDAEAGGKSRHSHGKSKQFAFAFVGDGPYGEVREPEFDSLIRDINRDPDIEWVLHAGDIKAGSERCDDDLILRRLDQYNTFKKPFILTPGDNEWTDCHRVNNGSYNPLERLAFLREAAYPNPFRTMGGKPMKVLPQSAQGRFPGYVENALWTRSGVVFATVHVVGSNNNLAPWTGIDPADSFANPRPDRLAEFQDREAAALDWIAETFRVAKGKQAVGVWIGMQANPRFDLAAGTPDRAGFDKFLASLRDLAVDFGKPVVLGHGDSHFLLIDQPLFTAAGNRLVRFVRVMCPGELDVHWVKVTVDPDSPTVFGFESHAVRGNVKP